jgi:hypothetical protein
MDVRKPASSGRAEVDDHGLVHDTRGKQRSIVPVAHVLLRSINDATADRFVIFTVAAKQVDQVAEPDWASLVWRAAHQDQTPVRRKLARKNPDEPEGIRRVSAVGTPRGQMMALVNDEHIPGSRIKQKLAVLSMHRAVQAGHDATIGQPGIRFERGPLTKSEPKLVKLAPDVPDESRRREIEHAQRWASGNQLLQDQSGLDGLAESDLVGDQDPSEIRIVQDVPH